MSVLNAYIINHTERNACRCGRCIDKGEDKTLTGHTANMIFFDVSLVGEPTREGLEAAIKSHCGEFCDVNPLDGAEHSYLKLGGWVGDQGLALRLMGLGALLRLWDLLTPYTVLGSDTPADMASMMAGMGMVSIQVRQ